MKAIILAGGKGKRLRSVAADIPKPLVKISDIPILEHQILLLKRYGLTDITILTGYLGDMISDYVGDGSRWGVRIRCHREDSPLGTAGAVKAIESEIDEDFVVFYGDVMLDVNLEKLCRFHTATGATATIVSHPNDHPFDSDLIETSDGGRIIKFFNKPHDKNSFYPNMASAALYVLKPSTLSYVEKDAKKDFARDVFPAMLGSEPIYGYNTAEYIKDVGTPERMKEVTEDFINGRIARYNCERSRPAVFLDRDGVINEYVGLLHRIDDMRLIPGAADAIKRLNGSDYLAIVVTNQPAIARNMCSPEELKFIHNKMESLLGTNGAKIDALYYCPHHPDKGYPEERPEFKIDCECRKPATGMIHLATEQFNIDLSASFLVGDSSRDIECGKNAGLHTIGVKTGEACADNKTPPDHICEDIVEAVEFILSR